MKKLWLTLSLALAAPLLGLALVANPASAEAAKVLGVGRCTILDGYGKFYRTTEKNKAVYNKSGDILKCSAKKVPTPGKTVKFDKASTGYRCGTGKHGTVDWNLVVSASGNATLTCKFKFPKDKKK